MWLRGVKADSPHEARASLEPRDLHCDVRIGLVIPGGFDRSDRERVIPSLLWLVERLAVRHDVHVFALRHDPEPSTYMLRGATVHDLGHARTLPGFGRRDQLARLMKAAAGVGSIDLLHAYLAVPAGWVTTIAAGRLGVPSVVTCSSGEWVSVPGLDYGLQRRWVDRHSVAAAARRATRVTVCTQFMARMAVAHGIRPDIIPLGVPPAAFAPAAHVEGPPWRLLHVASINPVKDHATLLHATAWLVQHEPRVHLDIVGEDTLGGAVQGLTARLGLDRHVTFHGFQPTDSLAAFYAHAHLHVVSSRHEGAGIVTLEAAAAGLATVGTAVGHIADWAAAGERAVAVPVGDAPALGAAILALLRDPERRRRIAEHARAWAIAHDVDWSARQFDQLYGQIARRS